MISFFRVLCKFCEKASNPTKKCSKSHSRCKGLLFCDKNCELNHHKKEKEAEKEAQAKNVEENSENVENDVLTKEMSEAAKIEKAKKKKARKQAIKGKKENEGNFWWNNSVYASW